MSRYAVSLVVALCSAFVPFAQAQSVPTAVPSGMDCKVLATMPNPPMSVESCEQMMRSHMEMMSALNTPGGERPGDAGMTCPQIIEEMKTMKVVGVSQGSAAEGKVAADNVKAIMQRAQAEAAGMAASQTARNAAAAAASTVGGNAVGGAVAAANMAEQKAFQDRVSAELNPARERLNQANNNSMGDLAKSMRENPRFARLINLGMQRGCTN